MTSSSLALVLALVHGSAAAEPPASAPPASLTAPSLACAVEWQHDEPSPDALCAGLGRELGRPVQRVADARSVKRGDAVQLLSTDLHYVIVVLRDGRPRAWTRVSKALAQGHEVTWLARVTKTLAKARAKKGNACVRVEPSRRATLHTTDLVYPWDELRQCKRTVAEVADPWND